jgi:hypothetical protein
MFWKSPMQMRREAEERGEPKPRHPKPRPVDPAKRPLLDPANWSAFLRTGNIVEPQS